MGSGRRGPPVNDDRLDEWRALASQGMSQAEASRAMGVTRERARQVAGKHGIEFRDGKRLPENVGRARNQPRLKVMFPAAILDSLGPHAARRGIHRNRLACLIVETAVGDGLIDSILDDLE